MKIDYRGHICSICQHPFDTPQALLMHVNNMHNMTTQFYYDKIKAQPGEGKCPVCNQPTQFLDWARGYNRFCSTKCAVAWQKAHAEETEMTCPECNETITGPSKNVASQRFMKHMRDEHKLDSKGYYDKYLRKEGEGICKECGGPTEFVKLSIGYRDYCSRGCYNNVRIREFEKNRVEVAEIKKEEKTAVMTEEMRQLAWQEECKRRLAEFEGPERVTYSKTDFGIMGRFGTITEWS